MHTGASQSQPRAAQPVARKAWTAPAVTDMPPLRDLTLQTGAFNTEKPGDGFTYA